MKIQKYGEEVWLLLYCDNLSAHLNEDVKDIFRKGKVLLCYFPPAMTEIVQPIDAGYGRSLRCQLGNLLDIWLMNEANLEKWETKMNAMERRVLVSYLTAEANDKMLTQQMDAVRIGCFERTGCLITHQVDAEKDKLIKPQGVTIKFTIPTETPAVIEPIAKIAIAEPVLVQATEEGGYQHLEQYLEDDDEEHGDDNEVLVLTDKNDELPDEHL
jgi:hypothetical protein